MPAKKTAYIIESEFLEDQVEKDVANYLGYISRLVGPRYRLLQVDEAVTGADARFNWKARAFFLQFKKPSGLKNPSAVPIPNTPRKNEATTQQIRRFRRNKGLADHPHSLYFKLREKAATAIELQHNILRSYEKPPHSRAVYVCPTFLTRDEYERAMRPGFFQRFIEPPLRFHEYSLNMNSLVYAVQCAPLLRGHATITPHATVATADHYYSFSVHGSDVAFHSPEIVRKEILRLSDLIGNEIRGVYENSDGLVPLGELVRSIHEISRTWTSDLDEPAEGSSEDWLTRHGRLLLKSTGIRQMVMLLQTPLEAAR